MADSLAFWSVTEDAALTSFPWGNVVPRSSGDLYFRVKNQSLQYTAQGVTVSVEDAPSYTGLSAQFYLSIDGRNFTALVDLGDLPASGISEIITIRRVIPHDAATGTKACLLVAQSTGWAHADVV